MPHSKDVLSSSGRCLVTPLRSNDHWSAITAPFAGCNKPMPRSAVNGKMMAIISAMESLPSLPSAIMIGASTWPETRIEM